MINKLQFSNTSPHIGGRIFEYDIKQAGFSITKKKLPKALIEEISTAESKFARQYKLGLFLRNNREVSHYLDDRLLELLNIFLERNQIKDSEIISVKRDAIFTTQLCRNLEIEEVQFVRKNLYSSYLNFSRYEFYFQAKSDKLDIKGINEKNLKLHEGYFLEYLRSAIRNLDSCNFDKVVLDGKNFIHKYLNLELDGKYYRNLDRDSEYIINLAGNKIMSDYFIPDLTNISWNYLCYLVKIIQLAI